MNKILREVLAEAIERLAVSDERLALATVTGVVCDPDFQHAVVLMSSLSVDEADALADARVRLQASIGREVRLKRTPLLRFEPDPAIAAGRRVEDILRAMPRPPPDEHLGGGQPGDAHPGDGPAERG